MSREEFDRALEPLVSALLEMKPERSAADVLAERFPVDGDEMHALAALFAEGVESGWLCSRDGGPGVSYSRVRKASADSELSIDAVRMDRAGPGHTHPKGEFDLCFAVDGTPTFDERAPGWTVYEPGSWHVPTVQGGTMNILYFLPGGAIEFGPR